jgi:hypothetical protein
VAFRYLSADEHPDHGTINDFRKRHLTALSGIVSASAETVSGGGTGLDGTRRLGRDETTANASKHKAMSYGRMTDAEEKNHNLLPAEKSVY